MLFCGKGDDYLTCYVKGMIFVGFVGYFIVLVRREVLVGILDFFY